ncbi:MAG: ribonuclease D [Hyphomicrobium sp.]|nr:ribonuclease D [Hyphomicrobium sp.]PPC83534.1 MAG: ribonuclease D [Hyphomicrobium sp.]
MRVITSTQELEMACREFAASPYVAVDTEFMREQTFWPQLCLVQLAGPTAEAIVDPMAKGIDLAPFWALMGDTRAVKVFHAARQDIEIVYTEAGIMPAPVFDTQVAAMVCGFGESVSYVNLVKKVTGEDLDKSSRFTDWSRRPLSEKQLVYALGDVTHLCKIYEFLKAELEKSGRAAWLDEDMAELTDPNTYETHPDDAWQRLKLRAKNRKSLAVLMELAAWRERLAQAQNVPRGRILRDEALYDLSNQMPSSTEQLGELRTLSEGFARSARARDIVEAVKRGLERDPKTVPPINHGNQMTAEANATVELLKVLLKSAAARHRVAPRMIADTSELERLASETEPDVPAMRGWRRQLFGEDAQRLKRGELALTLSGGEVMAIPAKRG